MVVVVGLLLKAALMIFWVIVLEIIHIIDFLLFVDVIIKVSLHIPNLFHKFLSGLFIHVVLLLLANAAPVLHLLHCVNANASK